jgi:hypothetical protein
MAKTKLVKSSCPPTAATVETLTSSPADEPVLPSAVRPVELGVPEGDALSEEERELNAIEAKRREIIGTVESKLKVALAEACAHFKLLTKLGRNDILSREDFADCRQGLCIGKAFAESEALPATTPKAPRAARDKSSLTVVEAILEALSDNSQMDIPAITAKVVELKGPVSSTSIGQGLVRLKKSGKIVSRARGLYCKAWGVVG